MNSLHPVIIRPPRSHARVHRFHAGTAELIAIERNIEYSMSEDLKQAGGNEALEKSIELDAVLPHLGHVYDLRTQKYLGHTDHIHFTLDPWRPSLFAVTQEKAPAENIVATLESELDGAK